MNCSSCTAAINSRQYKQSGLCLRCRKRKNAHSRKDKEKIYRKYYIANNKDKVRECNKQWKDKNLDIVNTKRRGYNKRRYKEDVNFKLKCILRARLKDAIKNNHKSGSAVSDLGCSIEEFKKYLENKFQPGMSWDNWKNNYDGWQIDHIKSLSEFNLLNEEELKKACHYTNMQPLWGEDHKQKTIGDIYVV